MIRVRYLTMDGIVEREFDDDVVPKVLQSGALKMVRLVEVEIPPLGCTKDQDCEVHMGDCGLEDNKDIVKTPEIVLAVFNGNYIMERIDEQD